MEQRKLVDDELYIIYTDFLFFFSFIFISWRLITLQYCSGFCHTLTWISHEFTCVPHPEPPSHLPPHAIPLGHPSASALSPCLLHPSWTGDLFHTWWYICFDALLSDHHTLAFSQSPKVCSIHLCLFFCLAYRVIITIFLNSIYMCEYTVLVFIFLAYFTLYNGLQFYPSH